MVNTTPQNRNTSKLRYQEIDILRGIAALSMIAFHTTFMIQTIFKKHISSSLLFWQGIPILMGGTFLILAGLSLYIAVQKGKYSNPLVILQRSGSLFCLGICNHDHNHYSHYSLLRNSVFTTWKCYSTTQALAPPLSQWGSGGKMGEGGSKNTAYFVDIVWNH